MSLMNEYDPNDRIDWLAAGIAILIMVALALGVMLFSTTQASSQGLTITQVPSAPTLEIFRLSGDGHFMVEAKPELIADKLYKDILRSYHDRPMCEGGVIWGVYRGTDHYTLVEAYVKDGAGALRTSDSAEKEAREVWVALRKLLAGFKANQC